MYTSGTTGRPKGAMICHRNLICNAITACHIMEVTPETKQIILTPLFHASALHSQLMSSFLKAGTSVIMKEFKTKDSLELMARERVTVVIAVPTMYWFWITHPEFDRYDLTSIEYTISGAAPAAPELIRLLAEISHQFINAGGQTESTSFTFALHPRTPCASSGPSAGPPPQRDHRGG